MAGLLLAGLFAHLNVSHAQSAADFKVDVQVTDQGEAQRKSAYRVALDRLVRRDLPVDLMDDLQRREVLSDAAKYVQSFRYRKFQGALDGRLMATRQVREGAETTSVIEVAFPAGLAGIIQQELAPVAVLEETDLDDAATGPVLVLIAVDQNATQFMIGGSRGQKFQSRLAQLGAAHSMDFVFPMLDEEDLQIISPTDVLYDQVDRHRAVMQKYATDKRLTGALFRLSASAWQSEWRYTIQGKPERTVKLTTKTLDEALITVVTELANDDGSELAATAGFFGDSPVFKREGVGVRINNINSLADYQQVLAVLREIDSTVVTEVLDSGAAVFRASGTSLSLLQESLATQPQFSAIPLDQGVGVEVGAQFRFR